LNKNVKRYSIKIASSPQPNFAERLEFDKFELTLNTVVVKSTFICAIDLAVHQNRLSYEDNTKKEERMS